MIPKEYTIHGHTIKVYIEEIDKADSRYGYYDDAREEIHIFKKVRIDNDIVELSNTQIESSFWHEVVHSFQFHLGYEFSEVVAQSVSGLILEFIKSSNIKIDPHVVHEVINTYED